MLTTTEYPLCSDRRISTSLTTAVGRQHYYMTLRTSAGASELSFLLGLMISANSFETRRMLRMLTLRAEAFVSDQPGARGGYLYINEAKAGRPRRTE